jgi:hypothetical protein
MKDSCLVIYQHLVMDANKREGQTAAKRERLQKELGTTVSEIRDGDVAFLIARVMC